MTWEIVSNHLMVQLDAAENSVEYPNRIGTKQVRTLELKKILEKYPREKLRLVDFNNRVIHHPSMHEKENG